MQNGLMSRDPMDTSLHPSHWLLHILWLLVLQTVETADPHIVTRLHQNKTKRLEHN